MKDNKPHTVWILANSSSAPYFNSFAKIAKERNEIKMSFICLFHERPKMLDEMNSIGFDCFWIKYNHFKRKRGLIKSVIELYKLLYQLNPDVVHSHLFDDSLVTMLASKLANIKKRIVTKGDTGFHYYYKPQWIIFDKLINYFATHIIAISNESKQFIIEKEKAREEKTTLIHHGLSFDKITRVNSNLKTELIKKWELKDKIVVGVISRFIEWKGYKNIIGAAIEIHNKFPNVVFILTGSGEQKNEIIQLVASQNLNNSVIFTEWIEPENIPTIYGIMDIFVHAAKHEPFGLVIAEAMINGIPVISTKTGAALDSISHLNNGYLCDYNNVNQLVSGLEFMIENKDRKQIGITGRKTAEELFPIELMYKKHLEVYLK